MGGIIVLIIIAGVGYFVYLNLPNTKYKKAQNLLIAKDYEKAANILNEIVEQHIEAPSKLAECKLILGQQASGNTEKLRHFKEVVEIGRRIKNPTSISQFQSMEAKAIFEMANIYYQEAGDNAEKLKQNIRFIDNANKKGSESNFRSLKTKHFTDLAKDHFKRAEAKEKSSKNSEVIEAIQLYTTSKDYAEKCNEELILNNSITRIIICQLKLRQNIDLKSLTEIKKSSQKYQNELFYRYAVQLVKRKDFSKAEEIILSHLNFESSHIDKLKEILKAERNNSALRLITEVNTSIEKLYNNTLSTEELISVYDSLEKTGEEVKSLDKKLSEKILALKPTLFNRLLTQYIEDEKYDDAIAIIQKYTEFWKSPELLKNLGICSYGVVSKGLLTERNYRIIISGWLTSVFSDKVILKSLDDTTWDDNYTFSLAEAIGSNYSQHEAMPDNVNYDEISASNISIGATQKELLQQFETIIHKEIRDTKLSKLVNDFYKDEKEAIEKIIAQIENDVFFATPYFAISNGLNNEIINELDSDYHNYSNEYALEAGVAYINNSSSTVVYQYFFAKDLIDRVKSAIDNENSGAIKKLNTKENKKRVEKFDNISSSVEDKLFNSISNKISEDDKNEKLISIMEECISFSNQNEKLKYQYSNYVTEYCIAQVNNKKVSNYKALSLLKGAYLHSPSNPKVVKNFITLIRFNLMDLLNDQARSTTQIYAILDWVKNNMSETYKQNSDELSKARRELLQQLQQAGVDTSLFDGSVLFSIASQSSLNPHGLKLKKILSYFKDLSNEQKSDDVIERVSRLRRMLNIDDDELF